VLELSDIHLTDKQNKGIKSFDLVKFGSFIAGAYVNINDRDTEKRT